jgi:branched-chain amino acid transport system permease protein
VRFVRLLPAVLVLVVAGLPLAVPWLKIILTVALAKGLAVLGVVVLLRAGQVSFGHAMFFAASAYSAAFLMQGFGGMDLAVLLLAGMVCSGAMGAVIGLFVVRYRYIFFGMLNLAFSMVLYALLEKMFHITGGSDGMAVGRPTYFGFELARTAFETALFYTSLVLAGAVCWCVHRFLRSPLGEALGAIRTNETRLEYLGISARRVLLIAYVLSAALAGLGGTVIAVNQGVVTPDLGYWIRSGEFVFIAILGGAGNVLGAFAGALVYELVRFYAAALAADVWQMILGFVLLGIILFASRGFVGLYQDLVAATASIKSGRGREPKR